MSKSESAFPDHIGFEQHANGSGLAWATLEGGLSKRELFAAMVLQGVVSSRGNDPSNNWDPLNRPGEAAEASVELADALLKALEKEPSR